MAEMKVALRVDEMADQWDEMADQWDTDWVFLG
jgi:hypothetical protein